MKTPTVFKNLPAHLQRDVAQQPVTLSSKVGAVCVTVSAPACMVEALFAGALSERYAPEGTEDVVRRVLSETFAEAREGLQGAIR